ncbi:MAG: hypothetical protein ACRDJN_23150, partial [Chloroflexota bacterium]
LDSALTLGYGPIERYGFHALEILQCMVERRTSGETGVAAVQFVGGEAMWEGGKAGLWDTALLDATIAGLDTPPAGDVRALAKEPVVFVVEYRDGLRAYVVMLNGAVTDLAFAARAALPGAAESAVVATHFGHHSQEPFGHFAYLAERIQDMICTGREPQPVERTLLTTGILDRIMESRWRGGVRLETPELAVCYRPAG